MTSADESEGEIMNVMPEHIREFEGVAQPHVRMLSTLRTADEVLRLYAERVAVERDEESDE